MRSRVPADEPVQKRRDGPRAAGLRSLQIRVPKFQEPGFVEECRRQSRIVAAADGADCNLELFIEAALIEADHEGKT